MMPLRILILGTGNMAATHAAHYAKHHNAAIVAGVDQRPENLAAFLKTHKIEHGFDTLDAALQWGEFDAVSNVTPDAAHHATTLPLLAAGKHVLCEKPLATNAADALQMAQAAEAAGVTHMVNLSYREVPALMQAHKMIAAGDIGEVRHFQASYLQSWLTQPAWGAWDKEETWLWRLSSQHGSTGVLGDVGIHILDFAAFAADAVPVDVSCRLTTFDKAPGGQIGPYVLDANDSFEMSLVLSNGATGVVHASRMASGHHNDLTLRIYGTKGGLEVSFNNRVSNLRACIGTDMQTPTWRDVPCPVVPDNYSRFVDAALQNHQVQPDFHRGVVLQRALDAAFASNTAGSVQTAV